jgi:hypothetical protein
VAQRASRLLHSVGDTTLGQVVRGHFNLDPVTGEDADVVLAHAAGDVVFGSVSLTVPSNSMESSFDM